jgi:hypothetical protein
MKVVNHRHEPVHGAVVVFPYKGHQISISNRNGKFPELAVFVPNSNTALYTAYGDVEGVKNAMEAIDTIVKEK